MKENFEKPLEEIQDLKRKNADLQYELSITKQETSKVVTDLQQRNWELEVAKDEATGCIAAAKLEVS